MIRGKKRILIHISIALLLLLSSSGSFVVQQRVEHRNAMAQKMTQLELSSPAFDSGNDSKPKTNLLGKIANTVSAWFHPFPFTKKKDDKVDTEVILSPRQELAKREINSPWPFSTIEKSITKSLSKEQKKARPLLKDAQQLIKKDKDLLLALGTPVQFMPVTSSVSSKQAINGKSTFRITDKFAVEGSKKSGVATLIADAHHKGHLQHLRVDIDGVHYDVSGTKDDEGTHLLHGN